MSAGNINHLLELWASTLLQHHDTPPFKSTEDLYSTIDSTLLGDVSWESFRMRWKGDLPGNSDVPPWMTASYEVWFRDPLTIVRNMLGNTDFDGEMDYAPMREFVDGERVLKDFMSGDWAWRQAVCPFSTDFGLHCLQLSSRMFLQKTQALMDQHLFRLY